MFRPRDCPGANCTRGAWHWDKRDYAQKYPPHNIPLPSKYQVPGLVSGTISSSPASPAHAAATCLPRVRVQGLPLPPDRNGYCCDETARGD